MIRALQIQLEGTEGPVEKTGAEALAWLSRPGPGVLRWIDLTGQTPADIERLGAGFGFHPLALEDCLHFDQRPKLEEYPGADPYLFIVVHNFREGGRPGPAEGGVPRPHQGAGDDDGGSLLAPEPAEITGDAGRLVIEPQEMHAFLGDGYLVTVHENPCPALDGVWRRSAVDGPLLRRGADFLYYLVADALCDSNFPLIEHLSDFLDDIEEAVLSRPEKKHLHRIYQMRKVLVQLRRVLSPQRDILALLSRHGGSPCVQAGTATYFRDVHDHLVRINEAIESGRDLLGNCVDAYLSAVGQRTNEIMKQLTILSCLLLPMTFLSGFFGMNFEMLPIHSWRVYIGTLVLMFVLMPGGMVLWFRHRRWL